MGMPPRIIGYIFLAATIALYAGIGIMSKTADVSEYYVAGRSVPALFNGMATGADWMSAASFIGMAGTLYLAGYDGLAFVMGWTGGYVLVALFLAPYLRKFGQFTIPDFLGARYGGNLPRTIGVIAAIICSFTYVVAQIYGVGIITSRFTGLEFQVGVFVGLAGILVCSFLGGMRAVTWTQVAQYIILIIAYMIPVVWLSVSAYRQPDPADRLRPGLAAGDGAGERLQRSDHRQGRARSLGTCRPQGQAGVAGSQDRGARRSRRRRQPVRRLHGEAERARRPAIRPTSPPPSDALKAAWKKTADGHKAKTGPVSRRTPPRSPARVPKPSACWRPIRREREADIAAARAEDDHAETDVKRRNFIALVLCLMVGTASLPHILMRYYTTPSVREARKSVFWSLFFIFLLYFTAPALAVLVKFEVYSNLVGSSFATLPAWVANWSAVDATLMKIVDVNLDGIVQLAEITIGGDLIVLATPEIAGLPYVISGMVAAGGLAAALSTADGLLLTIANALSHDVYYKMIDPKATTVRRLAISKSLLLVVALFAAYTDLAEAGRHPVPGGRGVLAGGFGVLPGAGAGVFWKRANYLGAVIGMLAGLARVHVLHVHDLPVLRRRAGQPVVRHQADLRRHLRHAGGLPRRHHRLADLGAQPRKSRSWSTMCATRASKATSIPARPDPRSAPQGACSKCTRPASAGLVHFRVCS
jgi:cation/acetate symporter